MPDETTILRFRRLLEEHKLAPQILALVRIGPDAVLALPGRRPGTVGVLGEVEGFTALEPVHDLLSSKAKKAM